MCDSPGSNQYKCIKYYILGIFFISIFALFVFFGHCVQFELGVPIEEHSDETHYYILADMRQTFLN